jgi:hypothetical protein
MNVLRRRGRIAILGLPYFGKMLAGLLSERGWEAVFYAHPGRDIKGWVRLAPALTRADIVYLISTRVDIGSPQDRFMRVRRRPVVVHWVGTDVLIALEEHAKKNISTRLVEAPHHWCDAPWLVNELQPMGIRAEYVPLPVPVLEAEPAPLPMRFRVLMYLPIDAFDREVFDMETLLRLPDELPEVEFILIPSPADSLPAPLPANLKTPGWVDDMDALYRQVTAIVRLVSHDGMSFMVLEALSRGRHVIYSYPLPQVIQASGFEAVASAIRGLVAQHRAGTLGLNEEGRHYALSHFDRETLIDDLDFRFSKLMR